MAATHLGPYSLGQTGAPTPVPPAPTTAALESAVLSEYTRLTRRRVLQGTCGWSDHSIIRCGRFYSHGVRTPLDRLREYATHFPCVEVDSTNYAIPDATRILEWANQTPKTFVFHFKIFALMTQMSVPSKAIPVAVRGMAPIASNGRVRFEDTSHAFREALWRHWNETLRPLHQIGQLGIVIFQFHTNFLPTASNKAHVAWCRSMLDPAYRMGIEFRSRAWMQPTSNGEHSLEKTILFARQLNCALIAEDDLAHEVLSRTMTLPPGEKPVHLPIELHLAATHSMYVRLHRRQGNQRVLADHEFEAWAQRFQVARDTPIPSSSVSPSSRSTAPVAAASSSPSTSHASTDLPSGSIALDGPIYFLIGTDHEDQPIINSNKMLTALQRFDRQREDEFNSSHASYSSPLSSDSTISCHSAPPEPLAFDYPTYYKQVLSAIHTCAPQPRAAQRAIGTFFRPTGEDNENTTEGSRDRAVRTNQGAPEKHDSAAISAASATAKSLSLSSLTPLCPATFASSLPFPSAFSSFSSSSSVSTSEFVSASSLPLSPRADTVTSITQRHSYTNTHAHTLAQAQPTIEATMHAATQRTTTDAAAAGDSSRHHADPSSATDIDIAAEVAAIERRYAAQAAQPCVGVHAPPSSPASSSLKRKSASGSIVSPTGPPSTKKRAKPTHTPATATLHTFFNKVDNANKAAERQDGR